MVDKIVTATDVARLQSALSTEVALWAAALPNATTGSPPVPDFMPKLKVDVTSKPGSALLAWADGPSGAPTTYKFGRNGTDTGGAGPWTSVALPPGTHTAELDKLTPGAPYIFTVTATTLVPARNWIATVSATIPKGTTTPPPPPPPGTGAVTWSSGVWANQDAALATDFAARRGQALGNIVVFTSRQSWAAQLEVDEATGKPWWTAAMPAGFTGDLVVKLPLWTMDGDRGTQSDWQQLANQIGATGRAVWVCLGWEMNMGSKGQGWEWQLTAANFNDWVMLYRQAVVWMKAVRPGLRFAWNPNSGGDQAGGDQRAAFQELKDLHHGYGPDSYDAWPPDNTPAGRVTHLTERGYLGESYAYAVANGCQFVLPEWGVYSGTQWGTQGGDNPQYVNDYMGFLASKQHETVKLAINGQTVPAIGSDSYFSDPADYLRSALWTQNPKAGAAYAQWFK